ncbi:MAG TPA: AraC family transcriptional regulator [Thermoanaerobaculia bacterium]|nr:AraC family transcriptional regulator [Thermoanaerobaculia bacterium]
MIDDRPRFWSPPGIEGLELLAATFTDQVFPRHTHDHYVIGINLGGVEGFERSGTRHVAPAGTIVTINPGDVHTGNAETEAPWVYRGFYPSVELISDITGIRGAVHFPSAVVDDADIFNKLLRAHTALECSTDELRRSSMVMMALHEFCARYAGPRVPERPRIAAAARVAAARALLLDRLEENVTLSELADAAGLSRFHLLRSFESHYGLPPHLYRLQQRVERAKDLLGRRTDIATAALSSGFTDQSHLTRWFKRFVGVTPAAYRRGAKGR